MALITPGFNNRPSLIRTSIRVHERARDSECRITLENLPSSNKHSRREVDILNEFVRAVTCEYEACAQGIAVINPYRMKGQAVHQKDTPRRHRYREFLTFERSILDVLVNPIPSAVP